MFTLYITQTICPFLELAFSHGEMPSCSHVLLILARENTSNLKLLIILLCMCKNQMVVDRCFCWKPEDARNVCWEGGH